MPFRVAIYPVLKKKKARVFQTPAYENAGGTGNRSATITASTTMAVLGLSSVLVNGNTDDGTFALTDVAVLGSEIKFNFGTQRKITEATLYMDALLHAAQGVWRWQGSDDGSAWFNIGNTFTLGGETPQVLTELSGNTKGYIFYRLLGVSGTGNVLSFLNEFEFKIGNLV